MLCDVNRLSSQQSSPTSATESKTNHLLAYAATYPVVKLVFRKSDMILRIISDASHLGEPQARSRVAGYFDLINKTDDPILAPPNGAVHVTSSILNCVVASAAEAEFGGLFTNAQLGVDIRNKLVAMGHPQPPTPLITDNKCALGIATSTTKPMKSKSMDMRFHWIKDRIKQAQFKLLWQAGADNLADYYTKVHPPSHHRQRRHLYVTTMPLGRHAVNSRANGVCYPKAYWMPAPSRYLI